jgi:DNA-binding response OmpR family regulator
MSQDTYRCGPLVVPPDGFDPLIDGRALVLPRGELQALRAVMRAEGRPVAVGDLGVPGNGDNAPLTPTSQTISHLNRRLREAGAQERLVVFEPPNGYRAALPVERTPSQTGPTDLRDRFRQEGIDIGDESLLIDGRPVFIHPGALRALNVLAEHGGEMLTTQRIRALIGARWGQSPVDASLESYIRMARGILRGRVHLEGRRRQGFRLGPQPDGR